MSARIVNVKPLKSGGQRVWFRCDECDGHGDVSADVETTNDVVGAFAELHLACASPELGPFEHAPGHRYGVQPGPNGMYARWCLRDDCDWRDTTKPGESA